MSVYKISVLGDLMCEPPYMNSCKKRNGKFDFWPTFKPLKKLLDEADYVIGNLETPVAGEELGYTKSMVSFNAPYEYLEALKKLGVDLLITANNHSTDRGVEGVYKTIDAIDKVGIAHTGTYKDWAQEDKNFYFTLGETKIAVEGLTYSCNEMPHTLGLDENTEQIVNFYRKPIPGTVGVAAQNIPKTPEYLKTKALFEQILGRTITWDENVMLKKAMGVYLAYPNEKFNKAWVDKGLPLIKKDYKNAKKAGADLVLSVPHSGGQFNVKPGAESVYVMKYLLNCGYDAVLMGHSHTTQRAMVVKGVPAYYALGNVTMIPNSIYPEPDTLPEFGLIPHLYVENGKIVKNTFSIYKILVDEKSHLTVVPCDELYDQLPTLAEKRELKARVKDILERVTEIQWKEHKPRREYNLL